jgi:hypothetical protein
MRRPPNRVFQVLIIVIAAYAGLWALTAVVGPRAVRPLVISALAIDESFRELPTTRDVYGAVGHVYALHLSSYAPFCVTVQWARSDQDFGSAETELYVWFGRAFHVHSFKNSGWRRERPNQAMERTADSCASTFEITSTLPLQTTRALVRRRSSCSR